MTNFFNFIYAPLRLRAFHWWLLACGGGSLLHQLLINFFYVAVPSSHVIFYWLLRDLFFVSFYLVVGAFQWLIIRKYFARSQGWLCVIALQSAIDWLIRSSFVSYYPTFYPVVLGFALGLAGWLFFRNHVRNAAYWIVATVITEMALQQISFGFASADPLFVVLSNPQNVQISVLLLLLQEVLRFAAQGCFTGWVLARFILSEKQADVQYL
ncbi:MAG: hypothetical protein ACFB0D_19730 [Phormidesmis sp.]